MYALSKPNAMHDDKPMLTYEVLAFVRNWLIDHILSEDIKLQPWLSELES